MQNRLPSVLSGLPCLIQQAAKEAEKESDEEEDLTHPEEPPKPNAKLEAGKKLPPTLEDYFLPEHTGIPLEDVDEFYQNKKVCIEFNLVPQC